MPAAAAEPSAAGFGRNDLQDRRPQAECPEVAQAAALAGGRVRQQPHDGLGQRGLRQSGHRTRSTPSAAMPPAGSSGRAGSGRMCRSLAAAPAVGWAAADELNAVAGCGAGREPATCVGESPSWLRHRILIPTCEGSSPSSPAKFFVLKPPALPCAAAARHSREAPTRAVQHRAVHRQRQSGAGAGDRHPPGRRARQGRGRPLLRRRGRRSRSSRTSAPATSSWCSRPARRPTRT